MNVLVSADAGNFGVSIENRTQRPIEVAWDKADEYTFWFRVVNVTFGEPSLSPAGR